jgi:hypothetical protein
MATQTVEFRAASGLTVTAKLFAAGSDTEVASVSATEATNRKGTYTAAYTDVAEGEYILIGIADSLPVCSWWVNLRLATATFQVYDYPNFKLDEALKTAVTGVAGAASTTTSVVTSSLSPAAAVSDQFKGLILKFTSDTTTANLRGQGCEITGSTALGVLTVSSLTTAPVSGDRFIIQ